MARNAPTEIAYPGPPTAGTFDVNDVAVDINGTVWSCRASGTPGTWLSESTGLSIFGSGIWGDVTLDGVTAITQPAGLPAPSGPSGPTSPQQNGTTYSYITNSDVHAHNLTVNPNSLLRLAGDRLFVANTLTVNGAIDFCSLGDTAGSGTGGGIGNKADPVGLGTAGGAGGRTTVGAYGGPGTPGPATGSVIFTSGAGVPRTITSITPSPSPGTPTVVVMSGSPGPTPIIGNFVVLAGITLTGGSVSLNGTFAVTNVSGSNITIAVDTNGCTYTTAGATAALSRALILGGSSGAGGNGASTNGAPGITAPATIGEFFGTPFSTGGLFGYDIMPSGLTQFMGGPAGGGGGGDGTNTGGNGGGGGGVVVIVARTITGTGTISSLGGAGGPSGGGNAGGGGGGGGGLLIIVTQSAVWNGSAYTIPGVTLSVAGGAGGAGSGTGANGGAGSAGRIVVIPA